MLLLNAQIMQTLGLAHQEWWCRPDDPKLADLKESGKWQYASERCSELFAEQMHRVISVCDREADIYDYLAYKLSNGERFVVRAKHLRAVEEANA